MYLYLCICICVFVFVFVYGIGSWSITKLFTSHRHSPWHRHNASHPPRKPLLVGNFSLIPISQNHRFSNPKNLPIFIIILTISYIICNVPPVIHLKHLPGINFSLVPIWQDLQIKILSSNFLQFKMTSCSSSRQACLSRCYSLKKIANKETVALCKVHSTLNFDSNLTGTRQILYLETDLILISSLVWLLRIEKSVIFILVLNKNPFNQWWVVVSICIWLWGISVRKSCAECVTFVVFVLFSKSASSACFCANDPQNYVQSLGPTILLILCIPSSKEYLGSLLLTVSLRWGQRDGGSWASSRT